MFARQMGIDAKILKWEVKGGINFGICKAEKRKSKIIDNVRMASKC